MPNGHVAVVVHGTIVRQLPGVIDPGCRSEDPPTMADAPVRGQSPGAYRPAANPIATGVGTVHFVRRGSGCVCRVKHGQARATAHRGIFVEQSTPLHYSWGLLDTTWVATGRFAAPLTGDTVRPQKQVRGPPVHPPLHVLFANCRPASCRRPFADAAAPVAAGQCAGRTLTAWRNAKIRCCCPAEPTWSSNTPTSGCGRRIWGCERGPHFWRNT